MTIHVPGYGSFEIPNERAAELAAWLEQNSVKINEGNNPKQGNDGFDGMQLLNG